MPKLSFAVPKYRRHKARNLAVVQLGGQRIYLGQWRSAESLRLYDQLLTGWLAGGRQLDLEKLPQGASVAEPVQQSPLTVQQLADAYNEHAAVYYRKRGRATREAELVREALAIACDLYGSTPAEQFGSKRLDKVRQRMIRRGWTRLYINKQVGRIKRAWTWAVEKELIRATDKYHALQALRGLHKGRTTAPDHPVGSVNQALSHYRKGTVCRSKQ
jgi:hypothetical protein